MASSPPGVDMMRSWMLVTDWMPPWLHSKPEDGEAVREPIGAVEKWPGRWLSEAIKYLFLLFWMSLRSEPTTRERERRRRERGGVDQERMEGIKHIKWKNQIPNIKEERGGGQMGKEKGQRGGKTNVRHTVYVAGLRQTPSMIVNYREQQFSLQAVMLHLLVFQRKRIRFQRALWACRAAFMWAAITVESN